MIRNRPRFHRISYAGSRNGNLTVGTVDVWMSTPRTLEQLKACLVLVTAAVPHLADCPNLFVLGVTRLPGTSHQTARKEPGWHVLDDGSPELSGLAGLTRKKAREYGLT